MVEQILTAVTSIRTDRTLLARDEASIKTAVVLRLIHLLGWNPFDVADVVPEYATGGDRVDFALRSADQNKVFIEVKRPREELGKHQEQLLRYAFTQGVRLAALTNGSTWWLYLPLSEGSWDQRRFFSLDLLEQDSTEVSERFVEYLAKPSVISGKAAQSAERLLTSQQTKAVLRDAIPRAWSKLLTEPSDRLVELLAETIEKQCGLRPALEDVADFLNNLSSPVEPPLSAKTRAAVRSSNNVAINRDFTKKHIESCILFDSRSSLRTWQELLLTVAGELYRRHPADFDRSLALRGTKMAYFSTNPSELKDPRRIADSKYYAESKLNANSIVRRSRELLEVFGYDATSLEVSAC